VFASQRKDVVVVTYAGCQQVVRRDGKVNAIGRFREENDE
jgi:hypothetical protein